MVSSVSPVGGASRGDLGPRFKRVGALTRGGGTIPKAASSAVLLGPSTRSFRPATRGGKDEISAVRPAITGVANINNDPLIPTPSPPDFSRYL